MKNLLAKAFALLLIAGLASCSRTTKELTVKDVVNEGETPNVYSVVDGTYTLDANDGLSIAVKIKLDESLGAVEEIGFAKDGPILQLLDKDGKSVSKGELTLSDDELKKLYEFVRGENGSVLELVFTAKTDKASDVLDKAEDFKLLDVTAVPLNVPFHKGPIKLTGSAGGSPFVMTLKYKNDVLWGSYYYTVVGPGAQIELKGEYDNGKIKMAEYANGNVSRWYMDYIPEEEAFKGEMIRFDGKSFHPEMKIVENVEYNAPVPSFNINFSDYYDESSSYSMKSGSGSESIDDLLDSYERYVSQYVSVVKKMNNDDPTALLELVELQEKAQDLSKKIENTKGDMSLDQINRFNQINQRYIQALQSMN